MPDSGAAPGTVSGMASVTENLRSRAGDRQLVRAALNDGPADLVALVNATLLTHSRVSAALEDLVSLGQVARVRSGDGATLWESR